MQASDRLAHVLAGHGVGPGQRVALLLSRSAEAVVAILGVLKTGAAYVPVDPLVPAARTQFVIADAAPAAAITTAEWRPRLDGDDLLVIDLGDIGDPAVDTQPSAALPGPAPDDVAYIIYTSGTTGTPKGVPVAHRNVTTLLESLDADLDFCGPGVDAVPFLGLRLLGVGDLGSRCSTAGAWWWCPTRWRVRPKTSTPCWSPNRSMC